MDDPENNTENVDILWFLTWYGFLNNPFIIRQSSPDIAWLAKVSHIPAAGCLSSQCYHSLTFPVCDGISHTGSCAWPLSFLQLSVIPKVDWWFLPRLFSLKIRSLLYSHDSPGTKLMESLLPQPPTYQNYRYVPPLMARKCSTYSNNKLCFLLLSLLIWSLIFFKHFPYFHNIWQVRNLWLKQNKWLGQGLKVIITFWTGGNLHSVFQTPCFYLISLCFSDTW